MKDSTEVARHLIIVLARNAIPITRERKRLAKRILDEMEKRL